MAVVRKPNEEWEIDQSTPLCNRRELQHGACKFCRQEEDAKNKKRG